MLYDNCTIILNNKWNCLKDEDLPWCHISALLNFNICECQKIILVHRDIKNFKVNRMFGRWVNQITTAYVPINLQFVLFSLLNYGMFLKRKILLSFPMQYEQKQVGVSLNEHILRHKMNGHE